MGTTDGALEARGSSRRMSAVVEADYYRQSRAGLLHGTYKCRLATVSRQSGIIFARSPPKVAHV